MFSGSMIIENWRQLAKLIEDLPINSSLSLSLIVQCLMILKWFGFLVVFPYLVTFLSLNKKQNEQSF